MTYGRITVKDRVKVKNLRNGFSNWMTVKEDTHPLMGMQIGDLAEVYGKSYRILDVKARANRWF